VGTRDIPKTVRGDPFEVGLTTLPDGLVVQVTFEVMRRPGDSKYRRLLHAQVGEY
jgi:hypothetical protein